MELIAVRGDLEAWAFSPFDPLVDDVTLRRSGFGDRVVRWQVALKFGYWELPGGTGGAEHGD